MRISKLTKFCFSVGYVLVAVMITSGSIFSNSKENYQASSLLPIKTSKIISPIYIDDLDPNHDWDTFISENPGYLGTGELGDPYIIYGREIDAKRGSTGITIKNSDAMFIIDSCEIFNTSQSGISVGIYLENVSHGLIMYSDFYDNGFFGVKVSNSSWVTILRNTFRNNLGTGIYIEGASTMTINENNITNHNGNGIELYNSQNIRVKGNNISSSASSGIFLFDTKDSEIRDNQISHNSDGIVLINSNHNTISLNTISYSVENGILIQNYSHYNSIKDNIISHALYYISIGDSSYGTYLLSNEPNLIRRFEDISNPLPPPLPNGEIERELEFPSYYVLFFVVICTITIILLIAKKRGKFSVY